MKNIIIILGIVIALVGQSQTSELLDSANARYNEGNYTLAINSYKKIISMGYVSADLHYNLGNAYYRTGDFPHAILNYERARKLSPNDEDIKFNLHLAYLKVSAKNETKPELTVNIWLKNIRMIASSNSWAIFSIISFIIFLSLVLVFLFSSNITTKRILLVGAVVLLFFSVIATIFSYQRKNDVLNFSTAVISDPTVTVKSSPDVNGNDVFIVYEGAMVSVKDSIPGWKRVVLQNGESGWIPAGTIVEI
ncbi:MAG: tetratricopeptide repeat protein [Bacteroidales bacterium]|nr:tetratricopeptide repeat protein [Bacteroidales bacterium]